MFKDGLLTYSSADTPWYLWDMPGIVLSSSAWAILLSVSSLQLAALVFDLLFGTRKSNALPVKLLGMQILSWKSSPLSISNALFRRDWITRIYYQGDISRNTRIARSGGKMTGKTVATLLLVVLVSPVIDIVSVAIPIRRTRELSFDQAGFNGVAFGLHEALYRPQEENHSEKCKRIKLKTRPQDDPLVRFLVCSSPLSEIEVRRGYVGIFLSTYDCSKVSAGSEESSSLCEVTSIQIDVDGISIWAAYSSMLITKDEPYYIRPKMNASVAFKLVERTSKQLADSCEGDTSTINATFSTLSSTVNVAQNAFHCHFAGDRSTLSEFVIASVNTMASNLTIIPYRGLEVVAFGGPNQADNTAMDAMGMAFIARRERNVSFIGMLFICLSILALRILCSAFVSNDVSLCLDFVIKSGLDFEGEESLIFDGEGVSLEFRKRYQLGEFAHYGLERGDIPEVKEFNGGIVGLEPDEEEHGGKW